MPCSWHQRTPSASVNTAVQLVFRAATTDLNTKVKRTQDIIVDLKLKNKFLTGVTACSKVPVTAAAFIWPDTHLIFLACEVAFTESWGEQEQIMLFKLFVLKRFMTSLDLWRWTYASGIRLLAGSIRRSTPVPVTWKCNYDIQNERRLEVRVMKPQNKTQSKTNIITAATSTPSSPSLHLKVLIDVVKAK